MTSLFCSSVAPEHTSLSLTGYASAATLPISRNTYSERSTPEPDTNRRTTPALEGAAVFKHHAVVPAFFDDAPLHVDRNAR